MKALRRLAGLFAVCTAMAAALVQPATAAELAKDPFITKNADRKNFEPGGQYHLFGSPRGGIANRTGSIDVTQAYTHQMGNLLIQQANIRGQIGYEARFSGHGNEVHAPFDNHASRSASDEKGSVAQGFTVYRLNWSGHEHHPADGYDGPQGGGYPAPTGARDEYRYIINGAAAKVNVNISDYRSTAERFADRLTNARNTAGEGLANAWERATAPNETLDWRGQTARAVNAALSGAAGVAAAGWEAIGAGDAADGIAAAKAVAGLEAIRALPPAAQIEAVQRTGQAVEGFENAYSRVEAVYNNWARRNPNAAEVAGVAGTVGRYAVERGIKSKSEDSGKKANTSATTVAKQGVRYSTESEAHAAAKKLGYTKTNEITRNGAAIYKRGNSYISRDRDSHSGGTWKEASSPQKLNSKQTRNGTFDHNLKRIGD